MTDKNEIPCYRCGTLIEGEMLYVVIQRDSDGKPILVDGTVTPTDPAEFHSRGYAYATVCPDCHQKESESRLALVETLAAAGEMDQVLDWMEADVRVIRDQAATDAAWAEARGLGDDPVTKGMRAIVQQLDDALRQMREAREEDDDS